MNIIITHGYSLKQKGDTALLIGTIKQMRKCFLEAQIRAQVMERTNKNDIYEGVSIMDSIIFIANAPQASKFMKIFYMAYSFFAIFTWVFYVKLFQKNSQLFLSDRLFRSCSAIYDADLVIPVAGGYIAGKKGILSSVNIMIVILPLWIAYILDKPVIHFSQSIGPLGNKFQRIIVYQTLRRAQLIITRESMSAKFVKDLGINAKKIVQSIDVGFLFKPKEGFVFGDVFNKSILKPSNIIVGITTKVHLNTFAQKKYEYEIAHFADWLCEQNIVPVFIPQITSANEDDRIINRRIGSFMKCQKKAIFIEKDLTNYETKAFIEELDFMIGTRFHSVIFALTGIVPSIAIEYEHKTSGIMHDLSLDDWVIKMEEVTAEKLVNFFNKLVSNKEQYKKHLQSVLPDYIERANKVPYSIRQVYDCYLADKSKK